MHVSNFIQEGGKMAHPSFDSCHLKLERAKHHLESLNDEIDAFLKAHHCSLVENFDPDTGEKIWVVSDITQPPVTLSTIVGDTLHNLRSALDHLVWALVETNGEMPTTDTAFPIYDEVHSYKSISPIRLKGISKEARAYIKSEQPCYRGGGSRSQHLSFLEELNNVDKHRHLHLVTASSSGGLWSPGLPVEAASDDRVFVLDGPVEDGTVVARVPGEYAYVNFSFLPDIAFGEGKPKEQSVRLVLTTCKVVVESIITQLAAP